MGIRGLITCVVATSEVVGGVFFAADKLLGVEQLAIGSGSDFVYDSRFQINKHRTRNVFAGSGFAEEGIESVISASNSVVTWHLPIRLDKNQFTNSGTQP